MLMITGLYASLLAFLIIFLAFRVVRLRFKHRVGILDGGHDDLTKAIRIHGNAIETIPVALILMACAESTKLGPIFLHSAGIVLIFARLYHAHGLSRSSGSSKGRKYGTLLTWLVVCCLGGYNLFVFARSPFL
jgi:uncharacterized membrane protein YecN with MAPEG domain